MKLTVAIVYCDKDVKYVPELVKSVGECINFSHEIVLIDNTTSGTYIGGGKYFCMGGNKYASMGRKKAVELAEGDYIWFVDADDEILPVPEFSDEDDMMIYSYEQTGCSLAGMRRNEEDFRIEGEWLFNRTTFDFMGQTLWNKIIRLSILKEVEKYIPDDFMVVAGEDVIIYAGCYVRCKSVHFIPEKIYRYRGERSTCGNPVVTVERFRHLLYGCKESAALRKPLCGDKCKILFGNEYEQDIDFYLNRAGDAPDEESKKEMIKILFDYFGSNHVLPVMDKYYTKMKKYIPA